MTSVGKSMESQLTVARHGTPCAVLSTVVQVSYSFHQAAFTTPRNEIARKTTVCGTSLPQNGNNLAVVAVTEHVRGDSSERA